MKSTARLLYTLIFILFYTPAFSQSKLIEKVSAEKGKLTIPYEKHVLSNGLTVIIHEDHSDPVVHVDVTYHVGSAREEVGKSGFAHFFEHMMFQGSKHVADEQHFKILSEAGADVINGTTNRDRTNYFETLPKNQLETALWLEADRMGFLLDSVTQKKFEIQRSTVKNERGQRYDNAPYGLVGETIGRALYPKGHPYSWLTIGYIDHLNAVDVNDLKAFFMRWYGPNNATLTVGGDVDPKMVLNLAIKYFGPIKKGQEVKKQKIEPVKLSENRYISMEDNIRFPLLQIVYPSIPSYHPDEAALDVLTSILSDGKSSLFYKNFIKSELAVAANCYNTTSELAGEFTVSIRAYPNVKLSAIDSVWQTTLKQFENQGISDEDLQSQKIAIENQLIRSLESVRGKAANLAAFQTFQGNPNQIQKILDQINKVTREDVMRVYQLYVKNRNFVALSVYPKGKINKAKDDNYTIPEPDAPAPHKNVTVKYKDPKDNFDRSKIPAAGPTPQIGIPAFYQSEFPNGLKVYGIENNEIPVVNIQITIPGGHLMDANFTEKSGLAVLTARLMNEGTATYSAEAFSKELAKIGSSISVAADGENIYLSVNCLKKNIDQTLGLLKERLYFPRFDQADFERTKKQTLEGIANSETQPTSLAENTFARLIYGEKSIKSIPASGTETTVKNITLDDVKNFFKTYVAPDNAYMIVTGDINQTELQPKIEFLNEWARKNIPAQDVKANYPIKLPTSNPVYFVNKEGAAQSEIRVGYFAMPFDIDGEFAKCRLMNYPLGGNFNSRLNLNLREDKGWTYGVRSGFSGSRNPGYFVVSGGFKKNATDSSLHEIMKELKNFRENGPTNEEVEFTKNALLQKEAMRYETLSQKASYLATMVEYQLPIDYAMRQYNLLRDITRNDLKQIAFKNLPMDRMVTVIVGDKKEVVNQLKASGFSQIVELDKNGNIVN